MRWYIVRGLRSPEIVEQDDIGEDGDCILFPCNCADKSICDSVHRVNKVYVGSIYLRTRKEAEDRVNRFRSIVFVKPSNDERASWKNATRAYVEQLELFYETQSKS